MNEHTNGNGFANGNGTPKKVFTLAPAPDDDTRKILTARWRVCVHDQVDDGAARLYTVLLDGSLNPELNFGRRGVISVSQSVLCAWLHCGERSIRTYVKQLVSIGELWTRYKTLPHGAKILEYFLTCIRSQDEFEFARGMTDQQLWGRANTKSGFQNAARGASGRFVSPADPTRSDLPVGQATPEPAEKPINAASDGNQLPPATATTFRGRRQVLPPTAAKLAGGRRQQTTLSHGNGLPPVAATGCRERRQNGPDLLETETLIETKKGGGDGETATTPTPEAQFQAWLRDMRDLFPAKRQALKRELQSKLAKAQSDEARAEWRRRIKAIDDLMHGGPVVDKPTATKPKTTTATSTRKLPTEAENLEAARVAVRNGWALTEGMRSALAKSKAGLSPAEFAALKSFPSARVPAGV